MKPAESAVPTTARPSPKFFAKPEAFRQWLQRHAGTSTELLVGFHKVGSGTASMTWSESVDEALCFGWIDGLTKRIDAVSYTIRFTPRKPTSIWSAVNIEKYGALVAQGRMTEAGAKAFALRTEAKSRVYAFEQPEVAKLTDAETDRFKANKAAWTYFEASPAGYRKVLLHWITTAKRDETRSSRLGKLIEACADGVRMR